MGKAAIMTNIKRKEACLRKKTEIKKKEKENKRTKEEEEEEKKKKKKKKKINCYCVTGIPKTKTGRTLCPRD